MKESAQIAYSYVRAQAEKLAIESQAFEKREVHLHVPAGAIPKDGPSAGIAMTMALASLFSNRPVRSDVGMTGEITLRGRILPVGGIKMKVLSAHRAGLTTVILPRRNARDLDDVPEEIRNAMQFILLDRIDEAIDIGLTRSEKSIRGDYRQLGQDLNPYNEKVSATDSPFG
jgi:ATP-dependent Lon protease